MPAPSGAAALNLSQILGWDTEHLYRAATDWVSTAEHWESSFSSVHRETLLPGGTVWDGAAADAAQERAFADLVKVRGLADTLHEAAAIARRGADQLDYLKRQALDAIDDALGDGFTVGEDLSVTDTSKFGGLRVGQVRQRAVTIASRAIALSAADNEIAGNITTVTAELANHGFNEPPADKTVQTVDYKTAPANPRGPLSEARRRAIEYADRWAGSAADPHRANPDYENFGDGGGDCTNFASQVMRAGGFKDVGDGIDDWHRGDADDWYYNNGLHIPGNTNSNTWSVAQANRDFIVESGRGQVVGTAPMPTRAGLDPLAPSKAGLVPGDLIYYHDETSGTINHTAVYVGQEMQNGKLVDVVDQHGLGSNNLHNDWMPDGEGFTGGSSAVEFVHVTYPGE